MTDDLQQLLDAHGIEHFTIAGDSRILSPVARFQPGTVVPPVELWPNIIPTLQLADEIREMIGRPIRVVSGYRSPEYNAIVGSTPASEHVQFRAVDLAVGIDDYNRLVACAASVMNHADARGMRTGFGRYDLDYFVHIDTGSTKGRRRRWKG
jgi:uncharacterized protein YcbK (DUF882 family)